MQVLLVGCGRMGGALLGGWRAAGLADVAVIDPGVQAVEGARLLAGYEAAAELTGPLCTVVAVKPAMVVAALDALRSSLRAGSMVISVAAGVTLPVMRAAVGAGPILVRTMPNTAAAIGKGVIGAFSDASLEPTQRAWVDQLLVAAGTVFWLDAEADLDAVTAVSGSGPAYFFRFTELLARAGRELGLPAQMAEDLARLTFTGAAALLERSGRSPAELRAEVTSPNGVTAAALAAFDADDGFQRLVRSAIDAAVARSREMGGAITPSASATITIV